MLGVTPTRLVRFDIEPSHLSEGPDKSGFGLSPTCRGLLFILAVPDRIGASLGDPSRDCRSLARLSQADSVGAARGSEAHVATLASEHVAERPVGSPAR